MVYFNAIITFLWAMIFFPEILKKCRPVLTILASICWIAYSLGVAFLFAENAHMLRGLAGGLGGLIVGWFWYHYGASRENRTDEHL